tara:strand:- start:5019 stop:5636 length:618 start_codon:yes stop_codon:yes gene_type:complete
MIKLKSISSVTGYNLNFEKERIKSVIKGKINAKEKLLGLGIILFMYWVYSLGKSCPCKKTAQNKQQCYRFEVMGIQVNHIYTFFFLGYFFHEYFFVIQILGILWELFEYYIDNNKKLLNNLGGCLDKKPSKNNWHTKYLIYAGKEKKYNIIDRIFGIQNSTRHGWHHSIAEIVINIISFIFGSYFKNIHINYIVLIFIIVFVLDI